MVRISVLKKQGRDLKPRLYNGVSQKNAYDAPRREEDVEWFTEIDRYNLQTILNNTEEMEKIVEKTSVVRGSWEKDLPNNDLKPKEKIKAYAELENYVYVGEVVGVIPNALRFKNDTEVTFEDVAVLKIVSMHAKDLYGKYVYVYQHDFSPLQTNSFDDSIGQLFPVIFHSLLSSNVEVRDNDLSGKKRGTKTRILESNSNQYLIRGRVDFAEYVQNNYILLVEEERRIENFSEDDEKIYKSNKYDIIKYEHLLGQELEGTVVDLTDGGVWVLSKEGVRFFIQRKDISYKYYSRKYTYLSRFKDVGDLNSFFVKEGDYIKAKIKSVYSKEPSKKQLERGSIHHFVLINATALPYDKPPIEVMEDIISEGRGRVYSGQIVHYDIQKGHLFEIDGAWGMPLLLKHSSEISEEDYIEGNTLNVRFEKASITWNEDKNGNKSPYVKGIVTYHSSRLSKSISRYF